jgi:hypothetical protein
MTGSDVDVLVEDGGMDQVGDGGSGTAVSGLAALPGRELQAALASIDLRSLCGADLGVVIQAQARLLAWTQAAMAATVREFVHCPASTSVPTARVEGVQEFACDELALVLHVAPMTGKHVVLDAVELVERHPRLWSALSDGLVDMRRVKAVTTLCPDTDNALAAALDDALLSTAVRADGSTAVGDTITQTPKTLGLRAQRILSALDPSWTRAVRRESIGRRRLARGSYGMGVGYLGLYDIGVAGMAAAYAHVDAIARGIRHLGDTRTLDQLRADTALDLLTGGTSPIHHPTTKTKPAAAKPARTTAENEERPDDDVAEAAPDAADDAARLDEDTAEAAGESDGPTADEAAPGDVTPAPPARAGADVDLIVHINQLADLADSLRRGDLIEVGGYGLVPADVAARLVKAAAARPSVWCMTAVDDDGHVVKHVRTHHDPTKAMRDYVNVRDRHCRFPGCLVTAIRCDTDHTIPHQAGGPTCPCNMAPLCRRHHRLKQAQGFTLTIDPETNTARWTTPHTTGGTAPPWTSRTQEPPPF